MLRTTDSFYGREDHKLTERLLRERPGISYLRHIRAALHWGRKVGMISSVPKFIFPDEYKRPGGRPLSLEEFERMIEMCRKRRGPVADSWEHLL